MMRVLAQRSRSQQFFQSTAEQWDHLRIDLFGQHLDSFVLAASLPPDSVVGELGCGSAPLCRLVAPNVAQAVAIDSSAPMLAAAKQAIQTGGDVERAENIRLLRAELSATTLPDEHLDLAWLILVLPYIDHPHAVLQEVKRILKVGARLVVIDLLPHERSNYRLEMGHLRLGVSKEQLSEWMSQAGLECHTYHPLPPDPQAKGPALFAAVASK
jgi:ArsR family transcriptional regulator